MYIVLSQKIETESTYRDNPFLTYHYPARYKNKIHTGDWFIYSQGNRYNKSQRYYCGAGIVGTIQCDCDDCYAALLKCVRFEQRVPLMTPDETYIEQIGYESIRKIPPWQSAVRTISKDAFDYIIRHCGELEHMPNDSQTVLEEHLKDAVRDYFVRHDNSAIVRISALASALAENGVPE